LYEIVGSAKVVDPEVIRQILLEAGYKFKNTGSIWHSADKQTLYSDPQKMLEDIKNGTLSEEVEEV
jgi:hypothetical protein